MELIDQIIKTNNTDFRGDVRPRIREKLLELQSINEVIVSLESQKTQIKNDLKRIINVNLDEKKD